MDARCLRQSVLNFAVMSAPAGRRRKARVYAGPSPAGHGRQRGGVNTLAAEESLRGRHIQRVVANPSR
jgi:hypothetical protein